MADGGTHLHDPLLSACRDLGRAMDLFDEAAAATLGVGRSDLRALNLLEHGQLGATALAEQLGLTRSAITALIDRLAAAGLVARVAVPGDRRATAVELQPSTWQAFAHVYRPLGERVQAATAPLPARDRSAVATAFAALTAAFGAARSRLTAGVERA
jgi:DNA-binding MarR family transcriptional regulator